MSYSLCDKLCELLAGASGFNKNLMVRPEVILWPDPENQWTDVIPILQERFPELLVFGTYEEQKRQGPAIWLKCMIARMLPAAQWAEQTIPIVYLPGIAKADLRDVERADLSLQPLLEYQYTGTFLLQESGREWTVLALVENARHSLGVKVAQDQATRDALRKSLVTIFQDREVFSGKALVDADYLNGLLFPDLLPTILKWICQGDKTLKGLDEGKRQTFATLCQSQFEFSPDPSDIKSIAEKLGTQKGPWKLVWQLYATAPAKYSQVEELLRMAMPEDLGSGMFSVPEESWPQINEQQEDALRKSLKHLAGEERTKAIKKLTALEQENEKRRGWVWYELGKAPLAAALHHLFRMATGTIEAFPTQTLHEIKEYYTTKGYLIDQEMRHALAAVRTAGDKTIITEVIRLFYQPWLEKLTLRFQALIAEDASVFTTQAAPTEWDEFILFVDAFRYELAREFQEKLINTTWKVEMGMGWSAIPSLTPTAKPQVSPVASEVSVASTMNEFRPQTSAGKDLQTQVFRDILKQKGYAVVARPEDITGPGKYWQEIGDIDTKGHEEQADMVRRVGELFDQVVEALENAFDRGVQRVRIVTDHGWLLLPGGLPKEKLHAGITETRWGRCAYIKDGAKTNLMQLPWRWNPSIHVAYAPGISFFKANVAYAHGGISLHECLVPEMVIEKSIIEMNAAQIASVKWVNLKCTVLTTGAADGYKVDIRTRYSDSKSSLVLSRNSELMGNSVTLMADDSSEGQGAVIVLLDQNGRILDHKPTMIGG
jgi:hypothetical protein